MEVQSNNVATSLNLYNSADILRTGHRFSGRERSYGNLMSPETIKYIQLFTYKLPDIYALF